MRKADLKMMFDGPEMGKAHLLGAHDLVHHVMKRLVLALAMLERAGYLDFVKDAEVHRPFSFVAGSIAESGVSRPWSYPSLFSRIGEFEKHRASSHFLQTPMREG